MYNSVNAMAIANYAEIQPKQQETIQFHSCANILLPAHTARQSAKLINKRNGNNDKFSAWKTATSNGNAEYIQPDKRQR